MTSFVRETAKRLARTCGVKLSRVRNDEPHQIVRGLTAHQIDVILDIGANTGQFAKSMREADFSGDIVCFEPLPEAHEQLRENFKRDNQTFIHTRTAIGDEQGSIQINVSRNAVSSSILAMLPSHSDAAPESEYIGAVDVEIDRLDNVFDQYVGEDRKAFLKIDTQGYEWNVLNGAEQSLKKIDGLLLEMSLIPLYEDQRLWKDILERLEREGFVLWQILPGFSDPESGRTLQFDGIFYRDESVCGVESSN